MLFDGVIVHKPARWLAPLLVIGGGPAFSALVRLFHSVLRPAELARLRVIDVDDLATTAWQDDPRALDRPALQQALTDAACVLLIRDAEGFVEPHFEAVIDIAQELSREVLEVIVTNSPAQLPTWTPRQPERRPYARVFVEEHGNGVSAITIMPLLLLALGRAQTDLVLPWPFSARDWLATRGESRAGDASAAMHRAERGIPYRHGRILLRPTEACWSRHERTYDELRFRPGCDVINYTSLDSPRHLTVVLLTPLNIPPAIEPFQRG